MTPQAPNGNAGVELSDATSALRALVLGSEHYRRSLAGSVGLGVTELVVMGQLLTDGPLTPREIATRIGYGTGSTTAVLDRIEVAGYLTRTPNKHDRRSVLIALTDSGRTTIHWIYDQTDTHMRRTLAGYTDTQIAHATQIMTAIGDDLRAAEPAQPPRAGAARG